MTDLLTMVLEDAVGKREVEIEKAVVDVRIEVAKNMLKEGLARELIIKIAKVDEETINRLQAELNNA